MPIPLVYLRRHDANTIAVIEPPLGATISPINDTRSGTSRSLQSTFQEPSSRPQNPSETDSRQENLLDFAERGQSNTARALSVLPPATTNPDDFQGDLGTTATNARPSTSIGSRFKRMSLTEKLSLTGVLVGLTAVLVGIIAGAYASMEAKRQVEESKLSNRLAQWIACQDHPV
ncbi:MAG: hypothetical protein M1812_003595 [Candelaria pacifica]|nr:MAG: hypothetical protein M1812_003595 [Candelaria pacifica]